MDRKDLPSPDITTVRVPGLRPQSAPDQKFSGLVDEYLGRDWGDDDAKAIAYLGAFLPVNNVCDARCEARFDVVTQRGGRYFREAEIVTHHGLEAYLERSDFDGAELCVLVAENICPYSICRLGATCDVRPKFWATHFEKARLTQDEVVDPFLPPAPSGSREFLNVQYVEPRELKEGSEARPGASTVHMVDCSLEMFQNPKHTDGSRPANGTNSVRRDVHILPRRPQKDMGASRQVAMVPGPLSAWTTRGGLLSGTDIMVVLIDPIVPRLEVLHNTHLDSKGAALLRTRTAMSGASTLVEGDGRRRPERRVPLTPKQRMAEYLTRAHADTEHANDTAPYGAIARLVFDQWRLTLGYMNRDVQLIQQRAEQQIPDFHISEMLLNDLFHHRQKCAEYGAHIEEAATELERSLGSGSGSSQGELRALGRGFKELLGRAEAQLYLLTSLTSIKEAQQGLEESHGVTRLSQIATIYLPFSTVAAVLAIPGGYGPGEGGFWTYWVASLVLAVVVTTAVVNYERIRVLCSTWTRVPAGAAVSRMWRWRRQGERGMIEPVNLRSVDDLEEQKDL